MLEQAKPRSEPPEMAFPSRRAPTASSTEMMSSHVHESIECWIYGRNRRPAVGEDDSGRYAYGWHSERTSPTRLEAGPRP
jgi:hypothetical protein